MEVRYEENLTNEYSNYNEDLFSFLEKSPTACHAVANMASTLSQNGFKVLREGDAWELQKNTKYYVTRNDTSIIAFYTGDLIPWESGIRLCGAHTDSPALKVKPIPELDNSGLIRLSVEMYGGALLNSWFDRGLNLAGRVMVLCDADKPDGESRDDQGEQKEVIKMLRINFDSEVGIVPSLPIHLDREANSKREINVQVDMSPLVCLNPSLKSKNSEALKDNGAPGQQIGNDHKSNGVTGGNCCDKRDKAFDERRSSPSPGKTTPFQLKDVVREQVKKEYPHLDVKKILEMDLFFIDAQKPSYVGFHREMILASRLDNLLSCHAGLQGIMTAEGPAVSLLFCADHEEVGSDTASGARGSFLSSVLTRLMPESEKRCRAMAKSFMISLDNAHAIHPAHKERYDANHGVQLNKGPVLKRNAGMRYASDCESSALLNWFCQQAGVPLQTFVMRSDMPCGSTIGPAVSSSTGIKTVDAGAPTLGMHAIREMTGCRDPYMLFQVIHRFFATKALPLLSLT